MVWRFSRQTAWMSLRCQPGRTTAVVNRPLLTGVAARVSVLPICVGPLAALPAFAKPAVQYLSGVLHSKAGHADDAEKLWRQVVRGNDRTASLVATGLAAAGVGARIIHTSSLVAARP